MCYEDSSITKCAESESYQSFNEAKEKPTTNVNSDTNGHTRTSSDDSINEGRIESRQYVELLLLILIISILQLPKNCLATIDDKEKKPQNDDESTDQEGEADSTKNKQKQVIRKVLFDKLEALKKKLLISSDKHIPLRKVYSRRLSNSTAKMNCDKNEDLTYSSHFEDPPSATELQQMSSVATSKRLMSELMLIKGKPGDKTLTIIADLLRGNLPIRARGGNSTYLSNNKLRVHNLIEYVHQQANGPVKLLRQQITAINSLVAITVWNWCCELLNPETSLNTLHQGQSFHGLANKQSPPEHMKSVVPNGTTRSKNNPTDTRVSTSSSPVNESASELSEAWSQNSQIQQDHILEGLLDEMKQPTTAIDKNEIEQPTTFSICNSRTNYPCAPIFITIGEDLQPIDSYDDLTLDNSSEIAVVVDLISPSEEQPGSEHDEVTAHIPQSGGLSSLIPLSQLAPETNTKKVTIDVTCNEVPDLETWSETFNSLTIQVFKHYQTNDAPFFQAPIIAFFLEFDPATLLNQRKRFSTLLDRLSTFSTMHKNIDVSSIEAASAGFVARQGIEPEFGSCSALLCLECCLVVDNLPRNVVIIAVHKTHSEKCKFILDFEQLNSSVDETAVAIPTSSVNGSGALSSMVVPGMVTKSEQSSEENNGTSDVSRRYDHIVMYSSKLLPVRKDDLTKGWSPQEMLDALPEGRAVLNVLDIDPTIDGLSTMMSEETRKESFRTYPNDLLLNITQLCAAGYFWTGKENVMMCCGCGVKHSGWDRNVPPLTRHLQLSPNCVFLKRSLTPEYLNSELVKIKSPYTPEARIPRKERVTKRDVALYIDSRAYTNIRDNPEKFGPPEGNRRKLTNELYKSVEYMRKFNLPIPGKEPEVIEMLKEMREREKKESKSMITNRPDRHVLAAVTHQFDENMQRQASELERKQQARRSQNRPDQQQPLTITQEINANEIAQSMRCKICLDKLCGLLLLPCSHIATCAGCGMSQGLCPICRGKITATTSIRFF